MRVHREAEGASFTGIKGADYKPEAGVELADRAIDSGSLNEVEQQTVGAVRAGLKQRFAAVQEAKKHANESVEEGRHFVQTYVEFIHYVERLHESATTPAAHHEGEAEAHR